MSELNVSVMIKLMSIKVVETPVSYRTECTLKMIASADDDVCAFIGDKCRELKEMILLSEVKKAEKGVGRLVHVTLPNDMKFRGEIDDVEVRADKTGLPQAAISLKFLIGEKEKETVWYLLTNLQTEITIGINDRQTEMMV
jgi:hypothetical protein